MRHKIVHLSLGVVVFVVDTLGLDGHHPRHLFVMMVHLMVIVMVVVMVIYIVMMSNGWLVGWLKGDGWVNGG
jgi:hypothetical protein